MSNFQKMQNLVIKDAQQDPVKYLKQQMLVIDSLEKARSPEYQAKLLAERKLKANRGKDGRVPQFHLQCRQVGNQQ